MSSNFTCRLCKAKATDAGFCQGHRTEFNVSGFPDTFAGRDSFVNQRQAAKESRREVLTQKPTPTTSKTLDPCQRVIKPCFRASVKPRKPQRAFCTVPICDRKHFGKGLCKPHYMRWEKLGRPDVAEFIRTTDPKINPPNFIIRPVEKNPCVGCGSIDIHGRGMCRGCYDREKYQAGKLSA